MRSGNYRSFSVVVLCVCLSLALCGMAGSQQGDTVEPSTTVAMPGEEDLQRTLDYLTEIATRTRLNADDTPGMVTVLYGNDLENIGIRTVAEAVSLVPGIRLTLAGENVWRMVARGIPRAFSSGQVKILLDGTPLTSGFGVDPVPNMFVEQVDRIEVVRGPVSVIHGEFADAGVMNIITRREKNRVYGCVGQHGIYTAGGVATVGNKDGDLRMSLNIAGQDAEGSSLYANPAGLDAWGADGPSDDAATDDANMLGGAVIGGTYDGARTYYSGIASLQAGPLDFQAHGFANRQPDFYDARLEGLSARHQFDPSDSIRVNWSLGWQSNRFRSESDFYSFFSTALPSEECLYGYDYEEGQYQGRFSVTADVVGSQTLMALGEFSRTDLNDVTRGRGVDEIRYEDMRRRMTSLTLQDEIRIFDALTVTAGVRRDHYDDIGDYTTPRLAAVWRVDPDGSRKGCHVFKAQLARSYRPPSFMDMLLDGDPGRSWDEDRTGQADTLELGYIYRSVNFIGRLTLFHSRIDPGAVMSAFSDEDGKIRSNGGEIELSLPLIPEKLALEGNVSLTTMENDSDRFNDGMASLILTARPLRWLALSLLYRFEDPHRLLTDRDNVLDTAMDAIHRLDVTTTLTPAGLRGVVLRAGVKNITGEDIRYLWYDNTVCYGSDTEAASVPEVQRQSRWWWASVCFTF